MTRDVETTGEGRGRSFTGVLTRGGGVDSAAIKIKPSPPTASPGTRVSPHWLVRIHLVILASLKCIYGESAAGRAEGGCLCPRDPRPRPRAPRPGARARSAAVVPAYSDPAIHWTTVYSASSKPGLLWTTRGFSRGPAATARWGDFALCGEEGREENQQTGEL